MPDSRDPTVQLIDKEIVDLLGLQDEYELSWEDYYRALREAAVAARMTDSKYSSGETEVITEELKRVKSLDTNTKFTTVQEKNEEIKKIVNPDKITSISKFVKTQSNKSKNYSNFTRSLALSQLKKSKVSSSSQENSTEEFVEKKNSDDSPLLRPLLSIEKTLDSILETLQNQLSFDKEIANDERKLRDQEKKRRRENKLEKTKNGFKGILSTAEKAVKPFVSIFEKIKNLLLFVLLGKAFKMFTNWFSDPNNQKTFYTILEFLGDHWIAISGALLLFGTGLGGFVRGLIGTLVKMSITMGKVIVTRLLPLLGKLGWKGGAALAGAALFTAGAVVPAMFPGTTEDDADKQANQAAKEKGNKQAAADIRAQNENRNVFQKGADFVTGAGAEREEQATKLETGEEKRYGFNQGGLVPGSGNQDTVPAMLTPGEFVVKKDKVNEIGADNLAKFNNGGYIEEIERLVGNDERNAQSGGRYGTSGSPVRYKDVDGNELFTVSGDPSEEQRKYIDEKFKGFNGLGGGITKKSRPSRSIPNTSKQENFDKLLDGVDFIKKAADFSNSDSFLEIEKILKSKDKEKKQLQEFNLGDFLSSGIGGIGAGLKSLITPELLGSGVGVGIGGALGGPLGALAGGFLGGKVPGLIEMIQSGISGETKGIPVAGDLQSESSSNYLVGNLPWNPNTKSIDELHPNQQGAVKLTSQIQAKTVDEVIKYHNEKAKALQNTSTAETTRTQQKQSVPTTPITSSGVGIGGIGAGLKSLITPELLGSGVGVGIGGALGGPLGALAGGFLGGKVPGLIEMIQSGISGETKAIPVAEDLQPERKSLSESSSNYLVGNLPWNPNTKSIDELHPNQQGAVKLTAQMQGKTVDEVIKYHNEKAKALQNTSPAGKTRTQQKQSVPTTPITYSPIVTKDNFEDVVYRNRPQTLSTTPQKIQSESKAVEVSPTSVSQQEKQKSSGGSFLKSGIDLLTGKTGLKDYITPELLGSGVGVGIGGALGGPLGALAGGFLGGKIPGLIEMINSMGLIDMIKGLFGKKNKVQTKPIQSKEPDYLKESEEGWSAKKEKVPADFEELAKHVPVTPSRYGSTESPVRYRDIDGNEFTLTGDPTEEQRKILDDSARRFSETLGQKQKFNIGGFVSKVESGEGLPITGAGKDDTLVNARVGDAVLTKEDQNVLLKLMSGAGIGGLLGGPLGAFAGAGIGAGIGKLTGAGDTTTIAVQKGEAIVSPEQQQTIFDQFGIDIPAWLSSRKPQTVDSDKIKTKSGVDVFNQGGVVKGYFLGGIVKGIGKAVSGVTKAISNPIGTVSNLVGGAIGGPFGNVLSTVGNIAGNFINPLGPAAGLLGGVGNIAGGIGNTIGNIAGGIGNTIGNIAGGIGDTIGNITGGISNIAGGALSSVGGAALNTVLPGIAPITQMLGSGLVDNIPVISQIKDTVGKLTKNLFMQGKDIQEQKILNSTQGTQITQQSLKNTMQDGAISDLSQKISQIAGSIGAAGGGGGSPGGGGGSPGGGGEGQDSSGLFGKIGDGVDGFLSGAKETIGGILGGIGEGLKLGGQGVLKALEYSPMGLAVKAGNEGLGLIKNIMSQGQEKKVSDSTQTSKPSAQATTRHAELMQSTNPQRIADYDAKHGAGSYSKKLQEKLNKTYSSEAPQQQSQPQSDIVPTGKVVGRKDLSPKAQEALARLDAQKAGKLQPDVKTTKKGGSPFGGMLSGMMGGLLGSGQKSMTVVDGNVGKPTAQEQKDIDNLAAKKAKLQQSQQKLMSLKSRDKKSLAKMGFSQKEISRYINEEKQIGKTGNLPKATFEMFGGGGKIDLNKPMGSELNSGIVKENTGVNIPGGTADRQLTALQPGEMVIPQNTVQAVGENTFNKIIARSDSNSNAFKMGEKTKILGENIKPYQNSSSEGMGGMIKLPPIEEGSKPKPGESGGDGNVPLNIPAICGHGDASVERKRILDTLGFIVSV